MVTRNDVAKHAGVSSATVSRVINGSDLVKDELKGRVEASILELGYKPNMSARRLRAQKTFQVAYVIPDIMNPYFTEIYRGMLNVFKEKRYTCHLLEYSTITSPDFYHGFDGLIVTGSHALDIKDDGDLPMILQASPMKMDRKHYAFINHNSDQVIQEVFEYVYELGHRQIGLITRGYKGNRRTEQYRKFHESKGIEYSEERIANYSATNYHYDQGYKLMNTLLERDPSISVVICQNDLIAMGAMSAAKDRGLKVPEDIGFVGNDDSVVAQYSDPRLTTIKLYKRQQGEKSAQMLLELMEGKVVEDYTFKAEFIHRKSI